MSRSKVLDEQNCFGDYYNKEFTLDIENMRLLVTTTTTTTRRGEKVFPTFPRIFSSFLVNDVDDVDDDDNDDDGDCLWKTVVMARKKCHEKFFALLALVVRQYKANEGRPM